MRPFDIAPAVPYHCLNAMRSASTLSLVLFLGALAAHAAETYQKPPKPVLDALNSPTTPTLSVSPARTFAIQGSPVRYPPIAELSQPMLRLAGQRINPRTNGLHNATFNGSYTLRKIADGSETKVELPPGAKLGTPRW